MSKSARIGADTGSMAPRFSILTPLYKTGPFAAQTVESVLAQSEPSWELLLIDNACPENSAEAVAPYLSDSRVTLQRRATNEGAAPARNDLLARARGRYVVQLDSDDWLEPGYLHAVGAHLDARPRVGITSPDARRYLHDYGRYDDRTVFEYCKAPAHDDHRRTLERLIRVNYMPVPFTVRRSALLEVGGWDPAAERIWDLALLIDVRLAGWEITTIREPLAAYRVRGGSTGHDTSGAVPLEIMEVREQFLAELPRRRSLPRAARRQAIRSLHRSRVRTSALRGDRPALRRAVWSYLRHDPSPLAAALALVHTVAPGATMRRLRQRT